MRKNKHTLLLSPHFFLLWVHFLRKRTKLPSHYINYPTTIIVKTLLAEAASHTAVGGSFANSIIVSILKSNTHCSIRGIKWCIFFFAWNYVYIKSLFLRHGSQLSIYSHNNFHSSLKWCDDSTPEIITRRGPKRNIGLKSAKQRCNFGKSKIKDTIDFYLRKLASHVILHYFFQFLGHCET